MEDELCDIVMGDCGRGKIYSVGRSGFSHTRKGDSIHEVNRSYVTELLKSLKTSLGDRNIVKGLKLDSNDKGIKLYSNDISIEYIDGKKIKVSKGSNHIELELVGI